MNHDLALQSCSILKGVGPHLAEKLAKCGIHTIQDLLFHLPLHYQDRTRLTPIATLRPGEHAVIEGIVDQVEVVVQRKPTLTVKIHDGTGRLQLRFFHFTSAQRNGLQVGMRLRCFGEVRLGFRKLEMIHPEYRHIIGEQIIPVAETLTPIYSTTEGLQQRSWRMLTDQALEKLRQNGILPELLPLKILEQHDFVDLATAIQFIHRPPPDVILETLESGTHEMQKRLIFEELLAHQLSLRRLRKQVRTQRALSLSSTDELENKFLDLLPFELTNAQKKVTNEIKNDLMQVQPMLRLVQGDVGSGKTVVAVIALLKAVSAGYQAAFMAPTDLLSEQHAQNLMKWLQSLNISVAWLAGKHKGKHRTEILNDIATGEAQIIVGTHALFQTSVVFKNLALIIIDEQHRFGVEQRLALREKGSMNGTVPHQLVMTATPIPRTLAMTCYADLDVSVIDELPAGRKPITTVVVPDTKRSQVTSRILEACLQGKQAYWVCPLIEDSEVLQCQAAEVTYQKLLVDLPKLRIGLVHGRLKPAEKEHVMQLFKTHELDLLIATTVVEVGVDVPNASLMIIENAERLGLAQLHQLRGRIGRGHEESYCVLLYQTPLSGLAKSRLKIMRETQDGFKIAQHDLKLRGPGELLGTKQTGLMRFRIADIQRDQALLPQVRTIADVLLEHYPANVEALIRRWLADGERYSDA
ncbi:MAG: ATP-dependent DNA helicase RecG [Gammaproteobacteria bacterium]